LWVMLSISMPSNVKHGFTCQTMLDDLSLIARRRRAFNPRWKPGDPIII
jgi:hypothetical protein